jgi:hypothetical protein
MKTRTIFLCIIFMIFISPVLNAQAVERFIRSKVNVATGRAAEKADEEVDKQINESVDKAIDNLLDNMAEDEQKTENSTEGNPDETNETSGTRKESSTSSSARSNNILKSLGIGGPVNISESYNYKGFILMDIENWDQTGKKTSLSSYSTYYNESAQNFAMEFSDPSKGKSIIIFDADNKLMVILSDDGREKSGIVTPLNYDYTADQEYDNTKSDDGFDGYSPDYKKTGRTKMVSGYRCEEYYYQDDESESSLWVTKDLPADLYVRMFSLGTLASLAHTGYGSGFTMEWDFRKKNSKERSVMIVKEVDKNRQTNIKTSGYNLINLGNMMQEE